MTTLEKIMYWIRPKKFCHGIGCYVLTPARKDGIPFCLACAEEGNGISSERW